MASVKENLIAAKTLIDTPEKWTKGGWRRSGCYCAIGALLEVKGLQGISGFAEAEEEQLRAALPEPFWGDVVENFNDDPNTTHEMIMQLFDRAIAAQDEAP